MSVETVKLRNGTEIPRRYTSVGGYPIFYLTQDNCVLCPDCAHDIEEEEIELAGYVNYESETHCEECGEQIEAAYPNED